MLCLRPGAKWQKEWCKSDVDRSVLQNSYSSIQADSAVGRRNMQKCRQIVLEGHLVCCVEEQSFRWCTIFFVKVVFVFKFYLYLYLSAQKGCWPGLLSLIGGMPVIMNQWCVALNEDKLNSHSWKNSLRKCVFELFTHYLLLTMFWTCS